jgi:hypothetical protein
MGGGGGKAGGGKSPLGMVGSVVGSMFQDEPEYESAPPPPQYITNNTTTMAEPEAPTTSTAADVATSEPVIDSEAARLRSDKRRRATQEAANALISLVSTSPTTKAKSLLGE